MNRRSFLRFLSAVPVGAVLAENPLARSIFLPPVGGWVTGGTFSNVLSTPLELTEKSLEEILIEIQKHPGPLVVRPTLISFREFKRIVEPVATRAFNEEFSKHPGLWESIYGIQEGPALIRGTGPA
jgi:hypothetical protein